MQELCKTSYSSLQRENCQLQCGFSRGRSCTDMVFMVQQLTEKVIKHSTKQFFVFVDLRKPYDSIPRVAIVDKLGVPEDVIILVKSFHEGMKARLRVDSELLEKIEVTNGLRQGYTLAPTLFNIYASIVAELWLDRIRIVEGVGTLIINKQDSL